MIFQRNRQVGESFAMSNEEKHVTTMVKRQLPVGAEFIPGGVHFRVWSPRRDRVDVVFEDGRVTPLAREDGGYFSAMADGARPGDLYRFRLDGQSDLYPDPASRFQPQGVHGPSQIVDPSEFSWTDEHWPGVRLHGQVMYEIHIGTFTPGGTWQAAAEHLPRLADLGITLIEVMPVAEFPGSFGWGYDGVDLFAPSHLYGTPDDFRHFVNEAHRLGLGVILDVVYNHFGPDGNYLKEFSLSYFTKRYENEWGEAINFDGADSRPVREFIVSNASYWIREFHLDGLRLDATQQIFDASPEHILTELARSARETAPRRSILLVAENEKQQSQLVAPSDRGGCGLDAMWNDDFHHTARVAATGRQEAYYSDYNGSPQEFISSLKWGFLYQGQYYSWQKQPRGTPSLQMEAPEFVLYLQNHDQIANSAFGERLHHFTSPAIQRVLTGLLLLAPGTPLLFQGQEFGASSLFLYFADHEPRLAELVVKGRREFLSQFKSYAEYTGHAGIPVPHALQTFLTCKLDHSEWDRNQAIVRLHHDLLKLRREDSVFSRQRSDWMHGAVLNLDAFALRYLTESDDDRLIVVNLGADLHPGSFPEPLIAPPPERKWELLWSSEAAEYGGCAAMPVDAVNQWYVYSQSMIVLKAASR
jgi:maltooligosyltrehalose trehalohydrolase